MFCGRVFALHACTTRRALGAPAWNAQVSRAGTLIWQQYHHHHHHHGHNQQRQGEVPVTARSSDEARRARPKFVQGQAALQDHCKTNAATVVVNDRGGHDGHDGGAVQPPTRALIHELHRALSLTGAPMPITQLSLKLTEESMDELEHLGGLHAFMRRHPALYIFAKDQTTGAVSVGLASALPVKGAFVDDVSQLLLADGVGAEGLTIEAVWERLPRRWRQAAKEHGSLEHILRRRPDAFLVTTDDEHTGVRRVRLAERRTSRIADASARLAAAELSGDALLAGAAPLGGSNAALAAPRVLDILLPYLPSTCFVPLVAVAEAVPAPTHEQLRHLCGVTTAPSGVDQSSLEASARSLFDVLETLPDAFVDLRVLGEAKEDVFLRFVGDGVRFVAPTELTSPKRFAQFALPPGLGRDLAGAFAAKGAVDDVALDRVADVVGGDLLEQMPLQGPASILVFERLQHLFCVNPSEYTVQLRSADGAPFIPTAGEGDAAEEEDGGAEFASLDVATSPAPRALRALLAALHPEGIAGRTVPLDRVIDDVLAPVAAELADEVHDTYGTVGAFIKAHAAYFSVEDRGGAEGQVVRAKSGNPWLLRVAAVAGVAGTLTTKDAALAKVAAIRDLLPPSKPVRWDAFARRLPSHLRIPTSRDPRSVFERYPELVTVLDPVFMPGWLLQRAGLPTPTGCHKKCETVADMLHEIAASSLLRTGVGSVSNSMSKNGLRMVKAFGGLDTVVTQLPEWFEFTNPSRAPGQGFIRYIGHETRK